jgi:hypothetical protein
MGSPTIAGWIAVLAFPVLLALGYAWGEIGRRVLVTFVALGAAAWFGLPMLSGGGHFVTPALAVIDIALVFAVFKRDVRIG